MSNKGLLLSIVAYARSGALDYAWRMLRDAGLERIKDDPAVLTVLGRLLKDRALRSADDERRRLYTEAAEAYARAAQLSPSAYPLINAATLSLLAGGRDLAMSLARQVLERAAGGEEDNETPYFREATRAEAYLLLADMDRAKSAFAEAVALAPRAYEDHASTLRQFGLILSEVGERQDWLEPFRPPKCLYFAGRMGIPEEDRAVRVEIGKVLERERVGFGYGALAAGADILIAEALLERNAQVHVILPGKLETFCATSVAPYGRSWVSRFNRILDGAESVRCVQAEAGPASRLGLQLAAEIAMGRAIMLAGTLMTEAIQLIALDQNNDTGCEPGSSQWVSDFWRRGGRRQCAITLPPVESAHPAPAGSDDKSAVLAALLRVEWDETESHAVLNTMLPHVADSIEKGPQPLQAPRCNDAGLVLAYAKPSDAASVALEILARAERALEIRMAGHYGIGHVVDDPFGGGCFVHGRGASLPRRMAMSTPPGAIHVSEDFAAALVSGSRADCPRTEFVGELPDTVDDETVRLYSVTR